jgi:hypothetical protein
MFILVLVINGSNILLGNYRNFIQRESAVSPDIVFTLLEEKT